MRILVIEPGGYAATFQYAHNLADALAGIGHEVTFATGLKFETRDYPRRYQVLEVFDRFVPRPMLVARFIAHLRRHPPEVVHIQGHTHPGSYLAFMALIRLFARPIFVYTAQDLYPKNARPYHPFAVPLLYRTVKHIFVNARQNKEDLMRIYKIADDKVTVIPLADLTAFLPHTATTPSPLIEPGKKIVLFFGNIEPRKGLLDLIAAFPEVHRVIPDAFLLIVGKPFGDELKPYQDALANLPREVRAATRLHPEYLPLTDLPTVVCHAHVWVMPYTRAAPNSGAIATAYGFGKPVVATPLGGIPEVVFEGRTGYLVEPHNPAALAGAIIKVLQDPAHYAQMLEQVRTLAAEHDWSGIARQISGVYVQLQSQEKAG